MPRPTTPEDRALVEAATATIRRFYAPDRHHVAAAIRTRDGRTFTAVNLGAYVGRCAMCAEGAVLAKAVSEGAKAFDAIAAVRWKGVGTPEVVNPCGICRELLVDYGDVDVVLPDGGTLVRTRASELLPARYSRGDQPRS
jgi:cytidine deaminase